MKLLFLGLTLSMVALISSGTSLFSQTKDQPVARTAKADDLFIDFRVGYPNWGRYRSQLYFNNIKADDFSTGGAPPLTLRATKMLSNEFSFSVNAIFNSWNGQFTVVPEIYDDQWNLIGTPETTEFSVQRFRFQIGINYHLDEITVENLDLFGSFMIGTNNIWSNYRSESETFSLINLGYLSGDPLLVDFPVSFNLRIGMRYMLSENLGLISDIGIGGPTITGGLTYRIRN
ncbi:MAG: hypothetical protein JJT77_10705 [Crocinitomicaceae bacterium]|nr:hypothetical protein [Crocinitomicaceae bacterium]